VINRLLGIPENASEHGYQIDHIIEFSHWFMLILFVGWSCFFLYTLFRFHRSRNPKADYVGAKGSLSTHIEFGVVLVEAVLLLGFAIPLWAKRVNEFPVDSKETVQVHVIGEQFGWTMHYPGADGAFGKRHPRFLTESNTIGRDPNDPNGKDDIQSWNDLHLPLNRPAIITLYSKDVIHNFALVHMRIAQDAIPGSSIPMWFKPVRTGSYEVICGQLCGAGHSQMKARLNVDTPEEYQEWLKERQQLAASAAAAPAPSAPAAPTANPVPTPAPQAH
jgi:cytochrome c oxidase subunit II